MKEIIICVGIPGSGKSTFAKEWVSKDPENRIRLNGEEILNSMTNNIYVKDVGSYIKNVLIPHSIKYNIGRGKSIVLDNTHIDPKYFYYIYYQVGFSILENNKESEYNVVIKDFTGIDPEICIKRDSGRIKPVGRKEIEKCYLSRLNDIKECINILENNMPNKIKIRIDKIY